MAERKIITCDWCAIVVDEAPGCTGWWHVDRVVTMRGAMIGARAESLDYCSHEHLAAHAQTGFRPKKRQERPV